MLPEGTVRDIMDQLIRATNILHQNNVCHRDLKPDNIMVSTVTRPFENQKQNNLTIKLIDFNVAAETAPGSNQVKGATGLREWSAPETR